jgi:phosphate transport system substrate-binding protein
MTIKAFTQTRSLRAGMALASIALVAPVAPVAAQNLTGAGATFPYPLYSKWFDAYNRATGVRINYQSIGSGGGIQQLKNGTVDFGATDAPLSNAEMKTMPGSVVHIPTVAGAVAIVYNVRGMGTGLRLDGATLGNIYLGRIRRWNDPAIAALNPGKNLPSQSIAVAHRSDGSGTTNIFTNYLKAVSPSWRQSVGSGKSVDWPTGIGGRGNDGVAGIVKQTPGGIGYVELAYATQNRLPYAAMRNRSGQFVLPSVAAVNAAAVGASKAMQRDVRVSIVNAPGAKTYPISGFTYLLVYKNQRNKAKWAAMSKFLTWSMGPGQRYAAPLLYAPLPRSVVRINQTKLRGIK